MIYEMDFTLNTFNRLLLTLIAQGFTFQSFTDYMRTAANQVIILRHDVDRVPGNALKIARLEHDLGIPASYYFRAVTESWDPAVIQKIAGLGHEIGYHYENLSVCNGDLDRAWADFQANLVKLRELTPVTTICMHGSPLSRMNNLDLWKKYDYSELGIIGEPYLDVDYTKVFYLTDTGRKWNNIGASIRDRVNSGFDIGVRNTFHIMDLAKQGALPDQMMITVHPQRWNALGARWIKEFIGQNVKNVIKEGLIKIRRF